MDLDLGYVCFIKYPFWPLDIGYGCGSGYDIISEKSGYDPFLDKSYPARRLKRSNRLLFIIFSQLN